MNRIFLAVIFLFIFTSFMVLNAQWAKSYGGSDSDHAHSIQQTLDGGYIVAGRTNSFGYAHGPAAWILKLSAIGDIEWQKIYGESNSNHAAHSIQQTLDGGYIIAGDSSPWDASGGLWILKLSSEGDIEWQETYGGSHASSIQQTMDGGYIVAGGANPWDTGYDIWISKLSPSGNIEWQKTYGGDNDDGAHSIQQTMDGGYIVAGSTNSFDSEGSDIWILKITTIGDIEWQKTYIGNDSGSVHSIQQASDGGYIIACGINVLKLSPVGDIEWQYSYGIGYISYVRQTMDGGYIVAGGFTIQHDLFSYSNNLCILKLSPEGEIEWQKAYGGGLDDHSSSIQLTSDGGYIVAGSTGSFGSGASRFDFDFWILKLPSNGELGLSCDLIKSIEATITDTDLYPEDTNIVPQDTNITPQETNVFPQTSNATVNDFCSGKYILCIEKNDDGTTVPSAGIHMYEPGTEVTIKATQGNFYRWWGGDVPEGQEKANPITITMDSHKSIRPGFISTGGLFGNGCFIATAAYGTPLHPYVETLRDFRDKYLMSNKLGRELVDLYYKYSPYVANIIARSKPIKVIVRIHLVPIIILSYSMVHLGPIITGVIIIFVFMLPFFFVMFNRRKINTGQINNSQ